MKRKNMEHKINIFKATENNSYFRQVLMTASHVQVVVMSIAPQQDIGLETHSVDQILVFIQGEAQAYLNDKDFAVSKGDLVLVPAGTKHNFINTGTQDLKLFTIYSPPEHASDTVHKTKQQAEQQEK